MPVAEPCFLKLRFPLVRDVQKPRHSTIDTIALRIRVLMADTGGSIAVQFAVLALVVIALAGSAIDYANVATVRSALQAAADTASTASIAIASQGYKDAQAMTVNGAIASAQTDAANFFNVNVANLKKNYTVTSAATVTKAGLYVKSSITFSASVPMSFLKLIGINTWTISGTSQAQSVLSAYLDFYLMVDVSGSLDFPSTPGEQSRLAAINPDNKQDYPNGCLFACHFAGYKGYPLSRNGGNPSNTPVSYCQTAGTSACIQLRTDAVSSAIVSFLQTANSSEKVANQYRVGLYPFIAYLWNYFALTPNIGAPASTGGSLAAAATTLSSLSDTGANPNLGSGGTHFENAMTTMNQIITSVGDGSSSISTLPFVFLITDGSQNNQYYWNGSWWGNNSPTTIDPSYCATLKSRGIKISILYIPYLPIPNPTSFGNNEDYYANANIPKIPGALQSCASSGFFFTANSPTDITNSLNAMFYQAVNSTRITN